MYLTAKMFITDKLVTDLIIAITTLGIAAYFYIKHKYSYWTNKGVAQLPPTFPFGNHSKYLPKGISLGGISEDFYNEFKKQGQKLGGVYLGLDPYLVVIDVTYARTIFGKDFSHFLDRGIFHNKKNPLTVNILTQGGEEWRTSRAKFTSIFTAAKMKFFFNTMKKCSDELKTNLEIIAKDGNADIDIYEVMACFFTDVIGSVTYGVDANSFKSPDAIFRKLGRELFGTFSFPFRIGLFLTICYPKFAKFINIGSFQPDIEQFFEKFVPDALDHRIKNNIQRADFLQLLIEMKNSGIELSKNEIIGQSFIFFTAGFETSSAVSSLMLYEICKNPDVQEKLRAEINETISKYGDLTYDATNEMPYFTQIMNETMRKYPLVPSLRRVCVKDYQFPDSNVVIEKGTNVILPVIGWHHDPDLFPDPEKFDPNRFEDKNAKYEGFFPFGEGPRNCIGARLGVLQAKLGVAELIRNYKITLSPNSKEPLGFDRLTFVAKTEDPILVRLNKINK
ncbi:unnamed protein product [Psylliodes chrysocephalus]|uniref:Cytochrome P450 n=1 Tax=Psylliodes chrysocephalus TaxID=3402493 RepID=A0A9P0G7P2_9CUCU|nr:unnamed protein product [Psylliodes chrysocephala]